MKNGTVDYNGTAYGSVASYTCDDGFYNTGSDLLECNNDGLWIGDLPVCESSKFRFPMPKTLFPELMGILIVKRLKIDFL